MHCQNLLCSCTARDIALVLYQFEEEDCIFPDCKGKDVNLLAGGGGGVIWDLWRSGTYGRGGGGGGGHLGPAEMVAEYVQNVCNQGWGGGGESG